MYDELVERLRYCADSDNQCLECKYRDGSPDGSKMCFDLLLEDAADAIEERDRYALTLQHEMMAEAESHIALVERLNKQIEELQKQVAHWQRELAKSMCEVTLRELEKPRWIPVTERLPEESEGLDWHEDLMIRFTSVWCCDAKTGTTEVRKRFQGKMTGNEFLDQYTEDTDWHWSKSWWEPTHWMPRVPLPEPPEEE